MKKKFTSIVMVAVIVITLALPINAIDIINSNYTEYESGQWMDVATSGTNYYKVQAFSGSDPFFVCCIEYNNSNSFTPIIVTKNYSRNPNFRVSNSGNETSKGCSPTDAVNGYYFYYTSGDQFVVPSGYDINCACYNYGDNEWDSLRQQITYDIEHRNDEPPSPTPAPSTINYSLPAGNIAIIETNSSYTYVNLTTTMPLQSTSFANNPWPNTTQRIGYYSTLPQTLNPNTMGNVIEWERNGNTTLFNITTSAKYNPSVVSNFKYVVIANPYYYPANDMEDSQYTNGAINISMDGVVNITVKSLTATVNTQTGAVEDNYNGTEWTGEVDETTNDIIWTDGNGENNAPTSGGNLSDPSITGFQSWLKGIMNNIVNIFQPAHDAINTLSSAVSNFASWMYALYVWLPSPILSLLTSAISLAIVIGIIKVFI